MLKTRIARLERIMPRRAPLIAVVEPCGSITMAMQTFADRAEFDRSELKRRCGWLLDGRTPNVTLERF